MPEAFYEQWERLRKAERRAYARALATPDNRNCEAWKRASKRLVAHENRHNTQ